MPDFKNALFLLLLIPLTLYFVFFRAKLLNESLIRFSSSKIVKKKKSLFQKTFISVAVLRYLALFSAILALARPGKGVNYTEVENYGVDIMIALDLSPSMMGMDLEPNRLEAAKDIIEKFAVKRENDRIGLVVFSGEAYLQAPLSLDKEIVKEIVKDSDFDSVESDGTAIGEAVALAAARLKDRKAESKIILLLTDGVSNRGVVDPMTAAEAAKKLGIKIYAVGIGKDGRVPYPDDDKLSGRYYRQNEFDEKLLRSMAESTGGKYYRAVDGDSLEKSVSDINKLEKSMFKVKKYYDFEDDFFVYLAAAFIFFTAELLLRTVLYRKIP